MMLVGTAAASFPDVEELFFGEDALLSSFPPAVSLPLPLACPLVGGDCPR